MDNIKELMAEMGIETVAADLEIAGEVLEPVAVETVRQY